MKYLSLFSGVGGFELGIKQAYELLYNQSKVNGLQTKDDSARNNCDSLQTAPTCIGFSEIDKYATQIYKKHFNHKEYGDITKINEKELPDFDLLVGGFPCQSFSIAGKRGGFEDTRGTMFFEIARIVREKQPRLLLLENVKGLLSHDKGKTFHTIIRTLDELGYDIQWQVLNSKNHGVPQNRERVFIIGHLRGTSRPEVFPFGGATETSLGDCQISNASKREFGFKSQSPTLMSRDYKDPKLVADYRYDEGLRPRKDFISPCLAASHKEDGLSGKPLIVGETKVRRLTPTECERLQGFPDSWTKEGINGEISDTQRYKTMGNAVTVNVIRDIISRMI